MDAARLKVFCPAAVRFVDGLNVAMARFEIDTFARMAMFLAQIAEETQGFLKLEENLSYSDPARVAKIFRKAFDRDHDGEIEPDEIELARQYCHAPEAMANFVYAGRYGNGDVASGDGWRYRGRSPIMTTFKENYDLVSKGIYGDDRLTRYPDLAASATEGPLVAGYWWMRKGCNDLADLGDFEAITRKINPGLAGAAERRDWFTRARQAFQ